MIIFPQLKYIDFYSKVVEAYLGRFINITITYIQMYSRHRKTNQDYDCSDADG